MAADSLISKSTSFISRSIVPTRIRTAGSDLHSEDKNTMTKEQPNDVQTLAYILAGIAETLDIAPEKAL